MKNISFAVVIILNIIFYSISPTAVLATSVDKTALCDLKGSPGEIIQREINLTGNEGEIRSGYWQVYYKGIEGDTPEMDITSWIEIEPREYTLAGSESAVFIISLNIPRNASAGLWGATSSEAGLTGHSAERRTYISFRDTPQNGNVYSGMLIPIAVEVENQPHPLWRVIDFISNNPIVTVMAIIIIILIVLLLVKKKPGSGHMKAK